MKLEDQYLLQRQSPRTTETRASREVHVSTALYLSQYDFIRRQGPLNAEVMIAATPRSGSTAFCLELWRTGRLGAPLEYANFKILDRIGRWKTELNNKCTYWKEVQSVRTSANGMFSYKFFIPNYVEISRIAPELLPQIAPSHVIYLTREDLLAQAISYSKAARSGLWFAGGSNAIPLEFDPTHIRECYLSIRKQMRCWEQIFSLTKTTVLRVTYEEMMRNPRQVVNGVVKHVLSSDDSKATIEIPSIGVQRDGESEHWKRMLQDAEAEWMKDLDQVDTDYGKKTEKAKTRQRKVPKSTSRGSGFYWSPERQIIFHRKRFYVHEGPTITEPSHDLAHVLVGMCSNLLWLPLGTPDEVKLAEYNAVFLEHLLSNAFNCTVYKSIPPEAVLPATQKHARWFVESHYAPFPVAAEEAYRRFCLGIDSPTVSKLAPYFFLQKVREQQQRHRKSRVWEMRVKLRVAPSSDPKSMEFRDIIGDTLKIMTSCSG